MARLIVIYIYIRNMVVYFRYSSFEPFNKDVTISTRKAKNDIKKVYTHAPAFVSLRVYCCRV